MQVLLVLQLDLLENLTLVNWHIKFFSEMIASITSCMSHKESINDCSYQHLFKIIHMK